MKKLASVLSFTFAAALLSSVVLMRTNSVSVESQTTAAAPGQTLADKSKTFGRRGPELYIENLPSTDQLLPAVEPRSVPALGGSQGAKNAHTNNTAGVSGPVWTAIGPFPIPNGQTEPYVFPDNPRRDPVSGRVTSIDIHPTNPDIAYVGTAQGGLYRTLNGGRTWTQLMDNAPLSAGGTPLAIGSVAISPTNTGTVFVGTGEGNLSGDSFFGSGFYIITNADSFNPVVNGPYNANAAGGDVFTGRSIVAIAVDPTNANNIFVSTSSGVGGIRSSVFSVRPARGLYRSTNALAGVNGTGTPAWERIQITGTTSVDTISTSVVMEPGNPNNLYVSFLGQTATDPAGIYRTTNALAGTPTFTLAKSTPLGAANGNSKLAITKPAGGEVVVYATTSEGSPQGQLYKSVNHGPFVQLPAANGFAGNQGFYDIAVGVDPTNANNVSIGGNVGGNIHRVSRDGGATLPSSVVSLHADTHAITYSKSNPNVIYHGNDGGIWRSDDGGTSWINLNNSGFSATQFSDIATHPTDRNFTLAGTQDNGTNLYQPDGSWFRVDFGDGGYSLIDRNATNTTNVTMYHTYFNVQAALLGTGRVTSLGCANEGRWNFRGIFVGDPNPAPGCDGQPAELFNGIAVSDNVNFYAPIVLGPGNPNTWYFGSDKLYRSMDRADTAQAVSQQLDPSNNVNGLPGIPVSSIAISPQNDNVRVVGLNNGKVFATTTGTPTLLQIAGPGATNGPTNTPASGNVTSGATIGANRIAIDPHNRNVAYVAFGGYGTPAQPIAHIYKTTNLSVLDTGGTVVFTPMSTGLPDLPHNAIAIDPQSGIPGNPCTDIYVGTDNGVYVTRNGGATWVPYGSGLPPVSVFGLEIQNQSRILRAATHGRGMYETFVALQPATPLLSKAASRKTHGSAGTFEVNLPLSGAAAVEPRVGSPAGSHTIVFTFTSPVIGGTATSSAGTVSNVSFNGNEMIVNLSGINDVQAVTVTANNVTSASGTLASVAVNAKFLQGDVDGNSSVTATDISQVKSRSGQGAVDGTNYRNDVTPNGAINSSDVGLVKSKSGNMLP
jgi:hypothetical protein